MEEVQRTGGLINETMHTVPWLVVFVRGPTIRNNRPFCWYVLDTCSRGPRTQGCWWVCVVTLETTNFYRW